ncbi:sugar kinase [Paracoccus sp. NSM]|uniref:sugar kinase n=1 Tax=Paracoccus sp. NSM TaxID=3457784 RepID=UPI0040369074
MTRILSIGEAMLELSGAGQPDLWRVGIAGDTLNTAWYLRRLLPQGIDVGYLTRLGTGPFSDQALDFMAAEGISTAHVGRDARREIGLYAITLTGGERSFSYWRDTSAARGLADDPAALDAALSGCDLAYLSGITMAILAETGRAALLAALARARDAGCFVAFDPNLRPRLWQDEATMRDWVHRAASGADLVLPSFDDEARHFGDADPDATLARYLDQGAGQVVVKNGGGPIAFAAADGAGVVAGLEPETPRDTTAAGDSFNAGYIAARLQGAAPEHAIGRAHDLSRRVIRHPGALVREAVNPEAPR